MPAQRLLPSPAVVSRLSQPVPESLPELDSGHSTSGLAVAGIPRRVYRLDHAATGTGDDCSVWLDRLTALGCDALLFAAGSRGHRLMLELAGTASAPPGLLALMRQASSRGIALYLEITLGSSAGGLPGSVASVPWAESSPERIDSEGSLDPRREPAPAATLPPKPASPVSDGMAAWQTRLDRCLQAGVAGFRLLAAPALETIEQNLIDALAAKARFIDCAAWPPFGKSPEKLAGRSNPAVTQLVAAAGAGDGIANPAEAGHRSAARQAPKLALKQALAAPRLIVASIDPSVDGGRYPVKRIAGETVVVEAQVLADGHDRLAVHLLWRAEGAADWIEAPMTAIGNDRYQARFTPPTEGRYQYTVQAWHDHWASFCHALLLKQRAGQPLDSEVAEGVQLISHAAEQADRKAAQPLTELLNELAGAPIAEATERLLSANTAAAMAAADPRSQAARFEPVLRLDAERRAAGFSAWYELFPRSMGPEGRHGTFDDVIAELPRIREMGFDVLYMPPIHPIGLSHRKGPNNTLTPAAGDPGSPYAIGSADGGHDAIHPELGTLDDFQRLRVAAAAEGLELALDFAIQCSPDHPWLHEHPEWFAWRADGSIRCAENPPKKYEDIVNVDFYAADAQPGLWLALRDVVQFWVDQGVRLFRVDNPHTKPLPFWEWLIADIRSRHPDTVFLAEAFTRPGVMQQLAKVGFSQSYTYFTWRNTKAELTEYLTELNAAPMRHYFRPHFFVNTPDINPPFLQNGGRPAHLIRAALAATLSGLWGVYSGFELCEATPLPGREEYLDSEKYQLRHWDWQREGHITREITRLNQIRRENPALHSQLGVEFLEADNEQVLFYEKATPGRDNVLLIAISLDPHQPQTAAVDLPLWHWQLPDDAELLIEDLLDGSRFVWRGRHQSLRLTPAKPYAIWRVLSPSSQLPQGEH